MNDFVLNDFVMKKKGTRLAGLLMLVGMSGCASMSSDECVYSDWHAVGYEDGARGYAADRFGVHRKACAKHGVTADFRAYQQGRAEGLVDYCQPSRGYNLGASGGRYHGVCDVALEARFLDAYRVGYQLYNLRSSVDGVSARIDARENELERTREKIGEKEALLIAEETKTEERILLLADLKALSERAGELEAEIAALVDDRAKREYELRDYEATVAAYGY